MKKNINFTVLTYIFGPVALYLLISELAMEAMDLVWTRFLQDLIFREAGTAFSHTALMLWSVLRIVIPAALGCLPVRRDAQQESAAFEIAQKRRKKESFLTKEELSAAFYGISDENVRRQTMPLLLCAAAFLSLGMNAFVLRYMPDAAGQMSAGTIPGPAGMLIQALCYCFFIPYVEETIFRGILYPRLQRQYGITAAVFVSGLLFGICHGVPVQIVYAFIMGMLFAAGYEAFGRFAVPFAMHGVCNLAVLSLQWTNRIQAVSDPIWGTAFMGLSACAFLTIYVIIKKNLQAQR